MSAAMAAQVRQYFASFSLPEEDDTMIEALKNLADAEQERAVATKLTDAETPGARIGFDPAEAERAGAFIETGLSDADAAAAEDGDGE